MPTEDQWETPLHRYISMVKDVQSYLEYTVEMERLARQMNEHGKQTRAYASLSFQYDTYRVARETYWGKMAQTYGVTSLDSLSRDMRALEPQLSGRLSTAQACGVEPIRPSHLALADADISDQNMKVWLSERIVLLALYRCELSAIGEQIEALDQHADFLLGKGQPVPEVEQQQRETLEGAYLSKQEEVQRAFEPCASHPFSLQEEMNISCQMLMEVNERLASQEHPHKSRTKGHCVTCITRMSKSHQDNTMNPTTAARQQEEHVR